MMNNTEQPDDRTDGWRVLSIVLAKLWLLLGHWLGRTARLSQQFVASCVARFYRAYHESIWDIFVFRIRCYLFNSPPQRLELLNWLNTCFEGKFKVANFTTDWRDGIRLCALAESLVPGVCPRYDLLSSSFPLHNIRFAFELFKSHLELDPGIDATDLHNYVNENKLILFLMQLKRTKAKLDKRIISYQTKSRISVLSQCFIKGMGLILGVQCRRARFSIHYDPSNHKMRSNINLVIEIIGPNRSFCSENVTFDLKSLKDGDSERFMQNLIMRATIRKKSAEDDLKIPFFVERLPTSLLITYIPFFAGDHRISICWQGQHVFESPYLVKIEETTYGENDLADIGPKCRVGYQYPLCLIDRFKNAKIDEMGTVIRKSVVKQMIVTYNKEYEFNDYLTTKFRPYFLSSSIEERIYSKNSSSVDNVPSELEVSNVPPVDSEDLPQLEESTNFADIEFPLRRNISLTQSEPHDEGQLASTFTETKSVPEIANNRRGKSVKEIMLENSRKFHESYESLEKKLEEIKSRKYVS